MQRLPTTVAEAWTMLERHLGSQFTLVELLELISASRGKPLDLVQLALPVGMAGTVLPLQDRDVIATRIGQDQILTLGAQLHECGHLLLGHVPLYVNGTREATQTWAELRHDLDELDGLHRAHTMVRRSHATAYDAPEEADAELLASLLIDALDRSQQAVPWTMQALYGYYRDDK